MGDNTIESVLDEHRDKLMALPGVVGTAVGECEGKPCIKVYVVRKNHELLRQIPSTLAGYSITIEDTGEIHALDTD